MSRPINFEEIIIGAYLKEKSGIVVESNSDFWELTGYSEAEITDKPLGRILNELLKITENIYWLMKPEDQQECFIFMKSLEARNIIVSVYIAEHTDEKYYLFMEKEYSRLIFKFPYLEQPNFKNSIGLAIFNASNLILLKSNQVFMRYIGASYGERHNCIGKSLYDIINGFSNSTLEAIWKTVIESQKDYIEKESVNIDASEEVSYWDLSIIPIFEGGQIKYLIQTVLDVTEAVLNRKRIEEQNRIILHQNEQLEAIISNMAGSLAFVDKDRNYLRFKNGIWDRNLSKKKIRKIDDNYAKGKYFNAKGMEIPFEDLPLNRIIKGNKLNQERLILRSPNGEAHYDISGTPIYDHKGEFLMGISCAWNVTESVKYHEMEMQQQKFQLEAEMHKREELEKIIVIKDEFISTISHEFKTPLTVINSAIQTMALVCRDELSEKAKGYIRIIEQNVFRQLRLVNNLLDITRANAGYIKANRNNIDIVSITKSIIEQVSHYANQKGLRLIFRTHISKKIIGLDEEKYERILLNIISNAIKFTSSGKTICVTISRRMVQKKYKVCIEVKDEGQGIPKEEQKRIFERFEQVDSSLTRGAEGTGIGLYLAKLFVLAMEGEIRVESEVGVGSTFTILLPAVKSDTGIDEKRVFEPKDKRLVQTIAMEFSDIYF